MVVVGFSSCHERPVVLNVVDPGHFHASLLQKSRLEGVDEKVRVYAPERRGAGAVSRYHRRV